MEGKTDKKEQPLSKKQIQEEKLRDAKMAEQVAILLTLEIGVGKIVRLIFLTLLYHLSSSW